jgi:hypothetical protein
LVPLFCFDLGNPVTLSLETGDVQLFFERIFKGEKEKDKKIGMKRLLIKSPF